MTAALEGGEWSAARPGRTLPGTHFTGDWGAPGPVWAGGKSRPHRNWIPDRPARSSVAIPTELPGPQMCEYKFVLGNTTPLGRVVGKTASQAECLKVFECLFTYLPLSLKRWQCDNHLHCPQPFSQTYL